MMSAEHSATVSFTNGPDSPRGSQSCQDVDHVLHALVLHVVDRASHPVALLRGIRGSTVHRGAQSRSSVGRSVADSGHARVVFDLRCWVARGSALGQMRIEQHKDHVLYGYLEKENEKAVSPAPNRSENAFVMFVARATTG